MCVFMKIIDYSCIYMKIINYNRVIMKLPDCSHVRNPVVNDFEKLSFELR